MYGKEKFSQSQPKSAPVSGHDAVLTLFIVQFDEFKM
jgi:hypothetical protein